MGIIIETICKTTTKVNNKYGNLKMAFLLLALQCQ